MWIKSNELIFVSFWFEMMWDECVINVWWKCDECHNNVQNKNKLWFRITLHKVQRRLISVWLLNQESCTLVSNVCDKITVTWPTFTLSWCFFHRLCILLAAMFAWKSVIFFCTSASYSNNLHTIYSIISLKSSHIIRHVIRLIKAKYEYN